MGHTEKEALSHEVQIFIAGNAADAERICRKFCNDVGFCVTVTPTSYIYTGGAESGVMVGCINYPRFPICQEELFEKATQLAELLCDGLYQHSYTIKGSNVSRWVSRRTE